MAESRGKAFEREFRKSLEGEPRAAVYRIHDSVYLKGRGASRSVVASPTPGDFWCFYRLPDDTLCANLVECKATQEGRLPLSMLTQNQVASLGAFDVFSRSSHGWVAVNFYDRYSLSAHNSCYLLGVEDYNALVFEGRKSVREDELAGVGVPCPRAKGGVYDMSGWYARLEKMAGF